MTQKKREHAAIKSTLHPRNKHRERYDFPKLVEISPDLSPFVHLNKYQDASIDFFDPKAVKALNKALLLCYYGVDYWDIPDGYLCPPIPGRADYLHHIADLLKQFSADKKIPKGATIKCLDIGVGANCVYPIIGTKEYGWTFIGSDIDSVALASAQKIIDNNAFLSTVELRLQTNPKNIFEGILKANELIDLSICNPPFHASLKDAKAASKRKTSNLKKQKNSKVVLNFGGQHTELWCEGGELKFVQKMIQQSQNFAKNCRWFSTLVSKEANLKSIYKALKNVKAKKVETLPMGQGNKKSRVIVWSFL